MTYNCYTLRDAIKAGKIDNDILTATAYFCDLYDPYGVLDYYGCITEDPEAFEALIQDTRECLNDPELTAYYLDELEDYITDFPISAILPLI